MQPLIPRTESAAGERLPVDYVAAMPSDAPTGETAGARAPRDYAAEWPHVPFDRLPSDRAGTVVAQRWAAIVRFLVEQRQQQRLTQRDLADLSGLRQATISELESGQRWPRIDTVILLAELLHGEVTAQEQD